MRCAAWIVAAASIAFGAPAFADEPAKAPDKKAPDKPAPPQGGLKETDPTTPPTNPWADAGLSKRHDGQQPSTSGNLNAPKRPPKGEVAAKPISAALLAGYASENYKIGFGAQAGYSIFGFYVGGTFVYHLGTSVGDLSSNVYYPGLELGYDLVIEEAVIRPYVGVDYVLFHASLGSEGSSKGYLGFHPGLHVDYQVPDTPAFVGIDARVQLIPDVLKDATPSIGVFLVGGARF